MITQKTIYTVKVSNEITLSALSVPLLLNKLDSDIKFWEFCLIGNKDKKFCKNVNKLIKDYKKSFKQVSNYKG